MDRHGLIAVLRYLLRRTTVAIPVLIGISIIVFALVQLQPGDPYSAMIDPTATAEQRDALLRRVGYYDPLVVKYLKWAGRAVTGDLGYSIQYGAPVATVIASRLGNTLLLTGTALAIALVVALPAGIYQGLRRNSTGDVVLTVLTFVSFSIPTFFLGMVLIKVFSANLGWLPASGAATIGGNFQGIGAALDVGAHLVLPALTLATMNIAVFARYLRANVNEIVGQDFIRSQIAFGTPTGEILWVHVLKNAAKPLITIISLEIPALLSGALLTETVFGWPGIGRLNYEAVINRDYSLLMGIIMFLAVATIVANLIADIIYAIVDPRVRVNS